MKTIAKNILSHPFYCIWIATEALILLLCLVIHDGIFNKYLTLGCFFWGLIILAFYAIRPTSFLNTTLAFTRPPQKEMILKKRFIIVAMLVITILACILPMNLNPLWTGSDHHHNQYELMADSILNGHVYIDYDDIDPKLEEMENPYDPQARREAGVRFHWDHAWYNGHYYMYFGIVPVFLLFIPFKILTGFSLATFHATQIFAALSIIGLFALFYQMGNKLCKKMSLGMYVLLAAALSSMSIWWSIAEPALYCTAITAGICMEVWSIFFFFRAVYIEQNERKRVVLAIIGALFGALAFGCRPPIALGNLLLIPFLISYIKSRRFNLATLRNIALVALPYVIIGILLMLYNYIRFDSFFEFGQSYQLTVADQSNYSNTDSQLNLKKEIEGVLSNFFYCAGFKHKFPYISTNGAVINFPILLLGLIIFWKPVFNKLRQQKLLGFAITLFILPIIITLFDVHWSPWLLERYRLDIYYLMGILCFLAIACWYSINRKDLKKTSCFISGFALITILSVFSLLLVAYGSHDGSPYVLNCAKEMLTLGLR